MRKGRECVNYITEKQWQSRKLTLCVLCFNIAGCVTLYLEANERTNERPSLMERLFLLLLLLLLRKLDTAYTRDDRRRVINANGFSFLPLLSTFASFHHHQLVCTNVLHAITLTHTHTQHMKRYAGARTRDAYTADKQCALYVKRREIACDWIPQQADRPQNLAEAQKNRALALSLFLSRSYTLSSLSSLSTVLRGGGGGQRRRSSSSFFLLLPMTSLQRLCIEATTTNAQFFAFYVLPNYGRGLRDCDVRETLGKRKCTREKKERDFIYLGTIASVPHVKYKLNVIQM